MDLCEEENDFRQKRKRVVFEAMKKLLGERGPKTLDEVGEQGDTKSSLWTTC